MHNYFVGSPRREDAERSPKDFDKDRRNDERDVHDE
jgi:hypothetical protein